MLWGALMKMRVHVHTYPQKFRFFNFTHYVGPYIRNFLGLGWEDWMKEIKSYKLLVMRNIHTRDIMDNNDDCD